MMMREEEEEEEEEEEKERERKEERVVDDVDVVGTEEKTLDVKYEDDEEEEEGEEEGGEEVNLSEKIELRKEKGKEKVTTTTAFHDDDVSEEENEEAEVKVEVEIENESQPQRVLFDDEEPETPATTQEDGDDDGMSGMHSVPSPPRTHRLDREEAEAAAAGVVAAEAAVGDRLRAGAREFVAGVRNIDDLVAHYLEDRRAESQTALFAQYLRTHLSPFSAPEKVRMAYGTLVYLVLFNSVYFSLVVIDQEEVKRVWLRYVMDLVGMISILFFLHFNYLSGAPNNHVVANQLNAVDNNNNVGNNGGAQRNYGLLLIGHAILYFVLLFAWIVLLPSTFFDPSLRPSHANEDVDITAASVDNVIVVENGSWSGDGSGNEEGLRLVDLDTLLLEQAARDPYALHSLKVVSLLLCVSFIEYALIGMGLAVRRLVGIYRIWLNTGTGHFVVHDIAEAAAPTTTTTNVAERNARNGEGDGRHGQVEQEEREEDGLHAAEEEQADEEEEWRVNETLLRRRNAAVVAGAEWREPFV